MKTTIDLPDELVCEAKLRAVAQGQVLKDLVADFIRQGLGHPALLGDAAASSSQPGQRGGIAGVGATRAGR